MLSEPALSLSDLALGAVTLALAVRLQATPGIHKYWRMTFWWAGSAAMLGAIHHAVVTYSERWTGPSWALISTMVVVAVSYLLAATVEEVLGPGRGGIFWALRSVGLIAYVILAIAGHAGVSSILACEAITMICVVALWAKGAREHHPLAWPVITAILVSGAAAAAHGLPPEVTEPIGLDPISVYHLAQIPGIVLLYAAATGWWGARRAAQRAPMAPAG